MYWLNRHLRDEAPHDVGSAAQALIDTYTRDPTRRRHPDVGDGPDLAAVVAAWPELPEVLKAGIVAMVKAARS